jgi:hypothetical protein
MLHKTGTVKHHHEASASRVLAVFYDFRFGIKRINWFGGEKF